MGVKEFLTRIFPRKKIASLRRTLVYLLEEGKISEEELKKREGKNKEFVSKILRDSKYCKYAERVEKKIEKEYTVKNNDLLLKELHSLINYREDKEYHLAQIVLGIYTLLITLFAISLSVMQFSGGFILEKQNLEYLELNYKAELIFSNSTFTNNDQSICLSNIGGMTSGPVSLRIDNVSFLEKEINSKEYNCFNLSSFNKNDLVSHSIIYSCLNCVREKKESLSA